MPYSFTFDNTAPAARPLTVDPLPLPVATDASSDAMVGTGGSPVAEAAPAAPDNTPPAAIP